MKLIIGFVFLYFWMIVSCEAGVSVYTSIESKDCKMLEDSSKDPKAEIDYFTMRCPGREGYEVFVQGGDLRSWLEIKQKRKVIYDMQRDESYFKNLPGSFPYLSGKKLEWRYDDANKLIALIIRVAGADSSGEKEKSLLFVLRPVSGNFCIVGAKGSNEEAQKLADTNQSCQPSLYENKR